MTNATKANLIALANAVLALLIAFGINLTDAQTAGILGLLNAAGIVIVSLTYKDSPKRIPDA